MTIISGITGFSLHVKRFIQKRRYRRLDKFTGERRRLRVVKLGAHKGRQIWKIKCVPKLKLKYSEATDKVSAKSWLAKLRDSYVNMMLNLAQSRIRQSPKEMGFEHFNDKVIIEIYKSLGIHAEVLPYSVTTTGHR